MNKKLGYLINFFILSSLSGQEQAISIGPTVPDPIPPKRLIVPTQPLIPPSLRPPIEPTEETPPGQEVPIQPPKQTESENSKDEKEVDPITKILNFWFGTLPAGDYVPEDKFALWFSYSAESERDFLIFSQDVVNARKGQYNSWRETGRGRLALILLLDSFPRFIYSGQAQQFISDPMAKALTIEGIQKEDDKRLYPIERLFFYLPLIHSEDLRAQQLGVAKYRQLFFDSPDVLKPEVYEFLQEALRSEKTISRFGRFPSRNSLMRRKSTPEETVYLNTASS